MSDSKDYPVKIDEKLSYKDLKKTRDGWETTTRKGKIIGLRTVRQALVKPGRGKAEWVGIDIINEVKKDIHIQCDEVDNG